MYLVSPKSYVTVAQMLAYANDFDLASYSPTQMIAKVEGASAWANSLMKQDLLAQQKVIRYIGDGSDRLNLQKSPLLYIKRAQIVVPGVQSYFIPPDELLIGYEDGEAFMYAPLYWAGAGYRSLFPLNAPIDVTLAWGYGFTAAKPPQWSAVDYSGGGLPAGNYNVAITTATFFGETSAPVAQYATATGSFTVTIISNQGAYIYRIYVSPAADNTTLPGGSLVNATSLTPGATTGMTLNSEWLLDSGANAEVVTISGAPVGGVVPIASPTLYAHADGCPMIPVPQLVNEAPVSAFAGLPITASIATLSPQNGLPPDALPTVDTSAPETPPAIIEAVQLLFLAGIFERNNKANRGVYSQRITDRMTAWKSTEGNSGKGVPTLVQQATSLLSPFIFRGMV